MEHRTKLDDCIRRIVTPIKDAESKHELNMAIMGLYRHPFEFMRLSMIGRNYQKECGKCPHYRFVGGDGYCTNQGALFEIEIAETTLPIDELGQVGCDFDWVRDPTKWFK